MQRRHRYGEVRASPRFGMGINQKGVTTVTIGFTHMDMLPSQSYLVQASTDTGGPENGRDDGSR